MSVRILTGDALSMLKTLESGSVQCAVTSPPYFQLRDYQTGRWEGGADGCNHEQARVKTRFDYDISDKQASNAGSDAKQYRSECPCGARRVDQQIGLERTPAAFLDALYAVFDEVRRVLRDDGVVFVNLGDSYAGSGKGPTGATGYGDQVRRQGFVNAKTEYGRAKSLLLIPERFAIGMADRGWIVRSQIVWAKKSAMPESVRDRPTSAWEPIWMFTKQARYFWDQDAVREPLAESSVARLAQPYNQAASGYRAVNGAPDGDRSHLLERGANIRNVWHLGPEPSRDAHFASYPTEIPRRCILAATRKGDTVLDPFLGSGTTALVADRLERNAIGIELSPQYAAMARRRIEGDAPLFADVEVAS